MLRARGGGGHVYAAADDAATGASSSSSSSPLPADGARGRRRRRCSPTSAPSTEMAQRLADGAGVVGAHVEPAARRREGQRDAGALRRAAKFLRAALRAERVIFPPGEFGALYPFPVHTRTIASRKSTCTRKTDADARRRFPRFAGVRGVEALLGPGDVLHIPQYWWHHINLDHGCVSLNGSKTRARAPRRRRADAARRRPAPRDASQHREAGRAAVGAAAARTAPPPSRTPPTCRPTSRRCTEVVELGACSRRRRSTAGYVSSSRGGSHEDGRVDVCVQRACCLSSVTMWIPGGRGPRSSRAHDLRPASRPSGVSTSARRCCEPRCVPRACDSPLEGPTDSADELHLLRARPLSCRRVPQASEDRGRRPARRRRSTTSRRSSAPRAGHRVSCFIACATFERPLGTTSARFRTSARRASSVRYVWSARDPADARRLRAARAAGAAAGVAACREGERRGARRAASAPTPTSTSPPSPRMAGFLWCSTSGSRGSTTCKGNGLTDSRR